MSKDLYISGLPMHGNIKNDLLREFGIFGEIERIDLPKQFSSGRFSQYAFLGFRNSDSAERAYLDKGGQSIISTRLITVQWAHHSPGNDWIPRVGNSYHYPTATLESSQPRIHRFPDSRSQSRGRTRFRESETRYYDDDRVNDDYERRGRRRERSKSYSRSRSPPRRSRHSEKQSRSPSRSPTRSNHSRREYKSRNSSPTKRSRHSRSPTSKSHHSRRREGEERYESRTPSPKYQRRNTPTPSPSNGRNQVTPPYSRDITPRSRSSSPTTKVNSSTKN